MEFTLITIRKINESYLKLDCELSELKNISENFTFYADKYFFSPKFKKKMWDGKIRLVNAITGEIPAGCYSKLIELLEREEYEYKVEGDIHYNYDVTDESLRSLISDRLKVDTNTMNQDQLDYQIDAALMTFKNNKNIILLPTGAGKSFAQFLVTNQCIISGFKKILIIVPTVNLVNQMEYDFLDYAKNIPTYKDLIHKIYAGQDKITNKKIVISTWQSLSSILKTDKEALNVYDAILVDEIHTAESGKELANIISSCRNAKIKLGMTGTLSGDKIKKEQLEALFGPILCVTDRNTNEDIDTNLLIDKGILTDYNIKMLVLKYPDEEKKKFKNSLKEIKKQLEVKFPDGVPKKELQLAYYNYESEYLRDCKLRTKKILQLVKNTKGNTLVLFKNVEYGEHLAELADKYTSKKVYLIHGSVTKEERERIRQIIDTETDVVLFGSNQIVSTGINIKSLEYLVFAQNSKSRIKLFQSIGRILRKFEGKNTSKFIDIVDDITGKNFSYKHALERIDIYDKAKSKYSITEVKL
jgi:superfamily II DNA or RNA helicase